MFVSGMPSSYPHPTVGLKLLYEDFGRAGRRKLAADVYHAASRSSGRRGVRGVRHWTDAPKVPVLDQHLVYASWAAFDVDKGVGSLDRSGLGVSLQISMRRVHGLIARAKAIVRNRQPANVNPLDLIASELDELQRICTVEGGIAVAWSTLGSGFTGSFLPFRARFVMSNTFASGALTGSGYNT
jgi:hypothetical protein